MSGVGEPLVALVAGRLELDGGVVDVEVAPQALADPVEHLAAGHGLVHHDVGRKHRHAAGDRPGMQIVHLHHARRGQQVTAHVPLTAHPNNMAVGKDGKFVYVGIIRNPGVVDVIDTATRQKVTSVPIQAMTARELVVDEKGDIVKEPEPTPEEKAKKSAKDARKRAKAAAR